MTATADVRSRIHEYFFAPQDPATLAVARITVFGLLLWKALSRAWHVLPSYPDWFFIRQAAREVPYLATVPLAGITGALLVASALGLLGVATRWMAATCFVTMYLLSAIDGGGFDSEGVLLSFVLLLAAARSDDVLAVGRPAYRPPSWEYRWPLRMLQITFALVYFEAGIEKLRGSGLAWIGPDTLAGWHAFHAVRDGHYFPYGDVLVRSPVIGTIAAGGALLIELAFFLVVFYEPLKRLLVPAAWLMHVSIGLTLNIWFTSYLFLLPLFFDWSRARRNVNIARPAAAPRRARGVNFGLPRPSRAGASSDSGPVA